MKAWVLYKPGEIKLEEKNNPQPAEDEVLVKVRAAGICGSDIPRIFYDGAHQMPLIPGHEFAGEVVEAGGKAGESWKYRRVGVFPLIPCRTCACCQNGNFEMCSSYRYLGSRQDGGFAEYASVPVKNLILLPDTVAYEQAAMLEPMAVVVHALNRLVVQPKDSVAVCGLGTIGMLMVMFLLARGIKNIYAIGNKDYQKEKAAALGLSEDRYIDGSKESCLPEILQHTAGRGVDVFFECVGKMETLSLGVESAAPFGRLCVVGNPHADMLLKREVYWKILRRQLTLVGTWNSSFERSQIGSEKEKNVSDWDYVVGLLKNKVIHPEELISHKMDFAQLQQGLEIMRDKKEAYVKIMITGM